MCGTSIIRFPNKVKVTNVCCGAIVVEKPHKVFVKEKLGIKIFFEFPKKFEDDASVRQDVINVLTHALHEQIKKAS